MASEGDGWTDGRADDWEAGRRVGGRATVAVWQNDVRATDSPGSGNTIYNQNRVFARNRSLHGNA